MPERPTDTRRAFFALVTKGRGALVAAIAIVPCMALLAAPLRRAIGRGAGDDVKPNRPVPLNPARAIFPTVLVAGMFGSQFATKPYFAAEAGAQSAPKVQFP